MVRDKLCQNLAHSYIHAMGRCREVYSDSTGDAACTFDCDTICAVGVRMDRLEVMDS